MTDRDRWQERDSKKFVLLAILDDANELDLKSNDFAMT